MRYSDTYAWSVNISIEPLHFVFIRVWIGDVHWTWIATRPLKVNRVDTRVLIKAAKVLGGEELKGFIATQIHRGKTGEELQK